MIYLLLSVLFNGLLFIILKLFSKYNITTSQGLVINYITAAVTGLIFYPNINLTSIPHNDWYFGSILLGLLFITFFYCTAITTQKNGIATASIASKMSMVIPVIIGVFLYKEKLSVLVIMGIFLALLAVVLTSVKKEKSKVNKSLLFPFLVFFGAGTIDSSLKYFQSKYITGNEIITFSIATFFSAFCFGIMILIIQFLVYKKAIAQKNILAGICLGIPNFFSLYFLIKMLEETTFSSATTFTIHNIAIVLFTALVSKLFLKEHFSKTNLLGIMLAILALFFITQ